MDVVGGTDLLMAFELASLDGELGASYFGIAGFAPAFLLVILGYLCTFYLNLFLGSMLLSTWLATKFK